MNNYKVGDVVEYTVFGGGKRLVLVEGREEDIKNGRPGFDGVEVDANLQPVATPFGSGVWGYDSQITRVIKRSS